MQKNQKTKALGKSVATLITICVVITGVGFFILSVSAWAQTPEVPGAAETGRIQNQLFVPPTQTTNQIVPPKKTDITADIPFSEDGFVLNGIVFEGMTAFEDGRFQALVAEYTGQKVDLRTLNHLAARITEIYREEGYFVSRALIPQQEVEDGIVVIQVIEGQVNNVIIDDPENLLSKDRFGIIEATKDKIRALVPLHGPSFERYILLLNDNAGLSVQSVLRAPDQTEVLGAVDVLLKITKKAPSFALSHNNHGSRFVGPHQTRASAVFGNTLNTLDQLSIQGSTAIPFREVQFGSIGYTTPITAEGLKLSLNVGYSNSEPGRSLRPLDVEGDSTTIDLGLSYPLIRSRRENLDVGVSFGFRNSATEFLDVELIDDKTRHVSVFTKYDKIDNWGGANSLSATLSKGLDILAPTETGSSDLSRAQGRSDYFTAELQATRQQELPQNFELINSVAAQYAPHPLLSSQELGYGGIAFGRAYDPSEITGDQGISYAAELRYRGVTPLRELNLLVVPFAFYDIGKVWNKDTGSKPESGTSAGFGTYFSLASTFSGSMQFAYPLTRSIETPVMNGDDGPRILFEVTANF